MHNSLTLIFRKLCLLTVANKQNVLNRIDSWFSDNIYVYAEVTSGRKQSTQHSLLLNRDKKNHFMHLNSQNTRSLACKDGHSVQLEGSHKDNKK